MMRFLKKLFGTLTGRSPNSPSGEKDGLRGATSISRYVYESNKFSESQGLIRPRAFLPEKHEQRYETSVCLSDGLEDEGVWLIGDTARNMYTKARGDLLVSDVKACAMYVQAAPENAYAQHAVIIGWSEEKDKRLMQATDLATVAILKVRK